MIRNLNSEAFPGLEPAFAPARNGARGSRVESKQLIGHRIEKILLACLLLVLCKLLAVAPRANAQTGPKRFTVADDIGLTQITSGVVFSPDERFFLVTSDRGRLDLNRVESSVRVYSTDDIQKLLAERNARQEPAPLWTVTKSTYKYGPIISNVQWLDDSSGFAFLAKTASGNDQLFLASLHTRKVTALTSDEYPVRAFVVRNETHFVYAFDVPVAPEPAESERATAVVGTGRSLWGLMFPGTGNWMRDFFELWAVVDGKRFRVADASSGRPVSLHGEGLDALALSPDGLSVVTALTVSEIPPEWETLYPPAPLFPFRVRAGRQDPDSPTGYADISEFVVIDLTSGKVKQLTHAPNGPNAGWSGASVADWSADGKSVVMSDTFISADVQRFDAQHPDTDAHRPCVAVADLPTGKLTCVERRREQTERENQQQWWADAHFVYGKSDRVLVHYNSGLTTTYVRSADGSWNPQGAIGEPAPETHPLNVEVKQDLNQPPLLIATDKQGKNSLTIWNPNLQLKDIQLGDVSVFEWRGKDGHDWIGGLYKPPDYVKGKRYPLLIQTHGFDEHAFEPSGAFTSGYAAQELAALGVMVLQVKDCTIDNYERGACQVAGYEAAVQQLAEEGLVDPDRVGLSGFSQTGYYVLHAMTTSALHLKAAAVSSCNNYGYLQYLAMVDNGEYFRQEEATIGAHPSGAGLTQWMSRSPEFNMDKVDTPLQVVAHGRQEVLSMWEPYAVLRFLNKPAELLVLSSDEHMLTNPAARMESQGGAVDWFRFWLKDEEDPDPAKAEQYARWRELRKLQQRNQSDARAN